MALNLTDRILTIVITATLTSAGWIIAGGSLMEMADGESQRGSTRPADAAPSPIASDDGAARDGLEDAGLELAAAAPVGGGALDQDGASQPGDRESRELMIPVLNIRPSDLSDTFTDARGGSSRLHEAIDIMAPEGTSVVAAGPGTIEKLFVSGAGGKTIYVRSPDKLTIQYYAHLKDYAEGLQEGQKVRRGQRLGSVGSTGNASTEAPHLHFALMRTTADAAWWEPANAVNPYPILSGK